jgi:hypothetical protein
MGNFSRLHSRLNPSIYTFTLAIVFRDLYHIAEIDKILLIGGDLRAIRLIIGEVFIPPLPSGIGSEANRKVGLSAFVLLE